MSCIRELELKGLIRQALEEDIGKKDVTTQIFIPETAFVKAIILAKQDGVVCGLHIAGLVFKTQDAGINFKPQVREGRSVKKGEILAKLEGKARSILTAERVALNLLSLLSGIATKTRVFINAIKPYKTKIFDTRKTIPGLRELQKYAVRIGGGYNHRMRLDEMALIKDNHLKTLNPKSKTLNPKQIPNLKLQIQNLEKDFPVEIEVKNLREFKWALSLRPDIIMLDNMSIPEIKKAVKMRKNSLLATHYSLPKLEVSGGVNLKNIRQYAACGVEMISIGELTHSVKSLDLALEVL